MCTAVNSIVNIALAQKGHSYEVLLIVLKLYSFFLRQHTHRTLMKSSVYSTVDLRYATVCTHVEQCSYCLCALVIHSLKLYH